MKLLLLRLFLFKFDLRRACAASQQVSTDLVALPATLTACSPVKQGKGGMCDI